MNKQFLIIGGLGVLALGGYFVFGRSATPSSDSVATDTQTPLMYATGVGTGAVASSAGATGTTDINSQLSAIMSAISGQSQNDLQASLASTAATRDIALAQTASDTQLGLAATNLSFMDKFMANIDKLKKAGISQISGAGGLGAGIVYSDPKKNMSYATGFDTHGNLMGQTIDGRSMILQQSAQQAYNDSIVSGVDGYYYQGSSGSTIGSNPKNPKPVRSSPPRNGVRVAA